MIQVTMTVRKFVDEVGETLIEPMDGKQLFRHCAGGRLKVLNKVFANEVKPLLEQHGIQRVYCE